jgi:hypothetical protein
MNSQQFEAYVPVYDTVPEKWEDARQFLVEHLKKISNGINAREIGFFLDEELLSGKAFIPGATVPGNPQVFRTVLRKVIDCGSLPNTGPKVVPHGIVFDANFTLVQLYGASTDPVNLNAIGLGHASTIPANSVELYMNATDIIIITGINRSSYTRTFVTVEYIQEL